MSLSFVLCGVMSLKKHCSGPSDKTYSSSMGGEQQPPQDLDADGPPASRGRDEEREDGEVERPLGDVAALQPALTRLLQEGVQVGVFTRNSAGGVHDVQGRVDLKMQL